MSRKLIIILMAVLLVIPVAAMAGGRPNGGGCGGDDFEFEFKSEEKIDSDTYMDEYIGLFQLTGYGRVALAGLLIYGCQEIDTWVNAVIKNGQFIVNGEEEKDDCHGGGRNRHHEKDSADLRMGVVNTAGAPDAENTAASEINLGAGAEGNVAMNLAAGTSNLQSNYLAIAVAEDPCEDCCYGGLVEAEIFSIQKIENIATKYVNNKNYAGLNGEAFKGASGNIALNIAAGDYNVQSNMLAIAYGPSQFGRASVWGYQEAYNNTNESLPGFEVEMVPYEKTWEFNATLAVEKSCSCCCDLPESAELHLDGSCTGTMPVWKVVPTENKAVLAGSAFAGANGAIAVNIAAGVGNMQANAASIVAIPAVSTNGCTTDVE